MTRPSKQPGLSEVQQAVYEALSPLMTCYDDVPENAEFPYSSIGETSIVDVGTKTENVDEDYETIHFWSRAKGFKEIKDLMKLAVSALYEQQLEVNGYKINFMDIDQMQTFRDPDGLTRHGILRIKFRILQP